MSKEFSEEQTSAVSQTFDELKRPDCSVLSPCFNETGNLEMFVQTIVNTFAETMANLTEIVLVDDGSSDGTWDMIMKLKEKFPMIVGIKLSRNFGKESALFAGLNRVRGDIVITMDADLQHPPQKIPMMVELWHKGFKIVNAKKISTLQHGKCHTLFRNLFFITSSRLTHLDLKESSDFKLLDKKVVKAMTTFNEFHLFYRGLVDWVGFKKTIVPMIVETRNHGTSSFTFKKLLHLAKTGIVSFSSAPLYIVTLLASIFFFAALILGTITLYRKYIGTAVDGLTTVILLQLISGGLIMFSLGLIGEYLGRVYDESKQRPRYVVDEEI